MKKKLLTYIIFSLIALGVWGQKQIIAFRTDEKPKIDGLLTDKAWKNATQDSNFIQYEPYNNSAPAENTLVQIAYDNNAIYISAICKNTNGTKLYNILSDRDDFGQADYFGFYIDPYNTGNTGYGFFVTVAGVQVDLKVDGTTTNYDWDAVWHSAVIATDSAYYIEMKIPYSALRFPQKDNQSWNINFYRNIQQYREISTWNFVDNAQTGILNQMGVVTNLKGIKPPVRFSLMPHISAYGQKYANVDKTGKTYSGGVDLKYGINESFTVDMMLIPDYNQIQADDEELNLSSYETYYDEKRYFFTEGTEIFDKGNIFYSRRIGKEPTKYSDAENSLNNNEVLIKNPQSTQILNATKISGKTNNGFGIGFLNAFTSNSYAEIYDTVTGIERTYLTEPVANYNVIAINKPIKNNSYFSFTNTNYASFGTNYYSNVSAQEGYFKNKNNSWAFFERVSMSNIFNDTIERQSGYAYSLSIAKTRGKFRVSAAQSLYDDKYNPNDIGYLKQNNIISNSVSMSYNIYKPFGQFLNWRNTLSVSRKNLYDSLKYIETNITFTSSTKLKDNTSVGATITLTPDEVYDYFEPRVEDKFYVKEPSQSIRTWISSNYANNFAYDLNVEYYFAKLDDKLQQGLTLTTSPRIRFSNRALFVYSNILRVDYNNIGYVGKSESEDSVFFGKRDIKYITNTIQFDYIISKDISIDLKIRHYWSVIDYYEYYTLGNNGKLYPLSYSYHFVSNEDINYNNFTVDLVFKWIFMPGSEFSVVYKKQITSNSTNLIYDYYDNFENMYFNYPRLNSISFKIIFYLDYNKIIHNNYGR